jgi:hypothetical protein
MNITFEMLVTAAAVPIAAGIITTLVTLLKTSFPILDARVSGAAMAFALSALLYVFAGIALRTDAWTANDALNVFLAWLAVASAAVGLKSTFDHVTSSSAKGWPTTDEVPVDAAPEEVPSEPLVSEPKTLVSKPKTTKPGG